MSKPLSVSLWNSKTGKGALSHKDGLEPDQLEAIKNMKPGDRLIVFANEPKTDRHPNYTIKIFTPREDDESGI